MNPIASIVNSQILVIKAQALCIIAQLCGWQGRYEIPGWKKPSLAVNVAQIRECIGDSLEIVLPFSIAHPGMEGVEALSDEDQAKLKTFRQYVRTSPRDETWEVDPAVNGCALVINVDKVDFLADPFGSDILGHWATICQFCEIG